MRIALVLFIGYYILVWFDLLVSYIMILPIILKLSVVFEGLAYSLLDTGNLWSKKYCKPGLPSYT